MGRPEDREYSLPTFSRPRRNEANENKAFQDLKAKFDKQAVELAQSQKDKSRLQNMNKTINGALKSKEDALKASNSKIAVMSSTAQAAAGRLARLQAQFNAVPPPLPTAQVAVPINAPDLAETIASTLVNKRLEQTHSLLDYHRLQDLEMARAAQSERNERHLRSEATKDNEQSRRKESITLAVELAKGDAAMTALLLEHMHSLSSQT